MITFFRKPGRIYAVENGTPLPGEDIEKLRWIFGDAECIAESVLEGTFTGPRKEMVTPWSTNAVEITLNMGIRGISRIEEFTIYDLQFTIVDPMLQQVFHGLNQELFTIRHTPDPLIHIHDIEAYNKSEGLALSLQEIDYLQRVSRKIGRPLTDSEIFGFSQVNSEHCRHKIFNGVYIIDGIEQAESLFSLIRKTAKAHPNLLVSAYSDNVAFISGPRMQQFAPGRQDLPAFFEIKEIESVISLKAETHNFPTTVEPFNGAATGSGGEIRDRMAGGKGSIPLAGTAVYMTSYSRLEEGRSWESRTEARKWLYHSPEDILIRASNGASDFGNKFGQPLICGSVLTFEHNENGISFGYDKVIMLAGGIGFAKRSDSLKELPEGGEKVIVLGGDNYRIGMGGGAVSSVATGEYGNSIELNAVQRSNPEMQKRVFNAIRAMSEMDENPVISIHDHGAGGHLNSISELVENTGGIIHIDALPIGDPTLSGREIISNESQERMGLIISETDLPLLERIAERERAPLYDAGKTTGNHKLVFEDRRDGTRPVDLEMEDFFGKPPRTMIRDTSLITRYSALSYKEEDLYEYLKEVLQLEAVACKDWLTNKVDRAVSGKIAMQQTCGKIQLPLNNLGVTALDYTGTAGIAVSIGHAPVAAIVDPIAGSRLSIAEALTNLVWAQLTHGLKGVSLSANWMWPCKNKGEDARLYSAVKAASDFAIELGINIPTGKDSLSMTQKYPDGSAVISPGTVIITAVAEVSDVKKVVSPVLADIPGSALIHIDFSSENLKPGGSSFGQVVNAIGNEVPTVKDTDCFIRSFDLIQELICEGYILAGHDVSAGGLVTTLLEMTFANPETGISADITELKERDSHVALFSENPAVVIQVRDFAPLRKRFQDARVNFTEIGRVTGDRILNVKNGDHAYSFDIDHYRDLWFKASFLLDRNQSGKELAAKRYDNYKLQPLEFLFPDNFTGKSGQYGIDPGRRSSSGIRAAIIREKGVNRDRDMAWALYLAGFDVKDVHMTDLISGRETLGDVNFIAFVGGFSNSDVLGSAKGWAGAFLYSEKAKKVLEDFYRRGDTLSLGVCNGCQLMVELGLIYPDHEKKPYMSWNDSHKYECAFISLEILENRSVMLHSLAGSKLGIWTAHGEGKFNFPEPESKYHIPVKYSYCEYPANPNGSMFDAACIASHDGRHLAIMPHLEDSVLPWQWAYYPGERKSDEITPWIEAFVNARVWIEKRQ